MIRIDQSLAFSSRGFGRFGKYDYAFVALFL
jgi:hypothetical protein